MIGAQYARPRTIDAAMDLLASLGPGASIIAGGQELMPTLNYNVFVPSVLVDINGLAELKGIAIDADDLSIGALSPHRLIERDGLVAEHAPLLAHAVAQIGGGWQVRNRGTIGGNIVSVHPLYDVLPPLLALDASVEIARNGALERRSVAALITSTDHGLGTEAILTRVLIPIAPANGSWGYDKLKNTHGAYASATAAARIALEHDGTLAELRVAIGSVEPLPRDLSDRCADLAGRIADAALLDEVEAIARAAVREPLSDQRGDAEYRTAMAGVSARRAVERAIAADAASRRRTVIGGL